MASSNSGWKHRLSNIDLEAMTADCQSCGVGIKIVKADRIRCWLGRQKGGKYGDTVLSYAEKKALFIREECAICKSSLSWEEAVLDHCHDTGLVREYLCNKCNLAIGLFGDNTDSLESAIRYIKKWREKYDS